MAINPDDFEVVGSGNDSDYEIVPTAGAEPDKTPLPLAIRDPYTAFKLQESKTSNREDYPITVPPSLNPNYDATRFMVQHPLQTAENVIAAPIKVAETGIRKLMDIPDIVRNKITGARPGDFGYGPNAYHPTFSERSEEGEQPIIRFPKSEGTGVTSGALNTASDLATSFLGNPEKVVSLALVPGEGVAGRTAAGAFGAQTVLGIPGAVKNAYDLTTHPSPDATVAQEVEALAQPIVQGALARSMLSHAAGPRESVGEIQGPPSIGSMLKTPQGAEAPLRVEDFEPLNTQSGSPLSPQELIARQSRVPTPPEAPAPEIKTWNLDEPEGEQNATQEGQQPESNKPEHTGDASQRPPAETGSGGGAQPGEAQPANEPSAQPGDARTENDQSASPLTEDLNKVAGMSEKEFSDFHTQNKDRGGMTGVAHEVGQSIETPEQLADLKSKQDAEAAKFQEAKKNKDFSAMGAAAHKGQFFREAYEAATGTGSAGKSLSESNPNYKPPFPDGKPRELVGMGGAVPSEFNPQGNQGREVYGVSQEVREARERAGQVGPVDPGVGIAAKDSVDHGRQLLKSGVDPEKALSNFEATGKWSSDDIAVTRAHGEQLAQQARADEKKFGTDSPEHKAAFDKLTDWDTRTKKLNTEWHKAGQAQQGMTDIDTGSFTGIAREFKNQTGKDLNPKQAKEAKEISGKVSKAADETEAATKMLRDELKKKPLDTERQRVADAAAKELTDAQSALELAKVQEAAAKRAQDAANKVIREAAVRRAEAENKQRASDAQRAKETAKIQDKAARNAQAAVDKTVREAAIERSKKENAQRVKDAQRAKEVAQVQEKAAARAREAAQKRVRDATAASAKAARALNVLKADTSAWVWKNASDYIDKGITNFDDLRNKLATDLGMPVEKITAALAKDKRAKLLSDDVWKKQQQYRRLDQQAKRWLAEQQTPALVKAIQALPNLAFAAKVFGHGTVALGTHAPMVAFQPRYWSAYARDFVKMYRMVGSTPFYENQIQDLIRRPNYTTARRAGLVNDPFQYEDYNSPEVTKWMGPVANMGNRGYSVLKILRQDMFDQQWKNLPKTQQIPEVAEAIADGINHATGVVRAKAPKGSNIALFAPRLAASRVAWLAADPLRAVNTFANWKNASEGEKAFAINQVKEKAWVVGTMLSLLAINEGILEATKSNQRVNFNDPMKKDWLKFKVGGMNVGYGNAMLSMARLPARLYKIRSGDGGKLKNLVYPDEDTYSVLGEYGRSQLSPFAGLALNLWLKSDWQNRPLPNSDRPVPKRLRAQGVQPYTWPEFWSEQALPIPAEEAAREVWKSGFGMNAEQIQHARKALATLAIMSATGARVEDDTDTVRP